MKHEMVNPETGRVETYETAVVNSPEAARAAWARLGAARSSSHGLVIRRGTVFVDIVPVAARHALDVLVTAAAIGPVRLMVDSVVSTVDVNP